MEENTLKEISKTTLPQEHEGHLNLTDLLKQHAATKSESFESLTSSSPSTAEKSLPPLQMKGHDSWSYDGNAVIGTIVESGTVGLITGTTKTLLEDGKAHYTLQLSDGINGAFRGFAGTMGINIVDEVLAEKYKSDLLKPNLTESIAMSAAFGITDTRLRLAAIGGSWLLGRAVNYFEDKFEGKR